MTEYRKGSHIVYDIKYHVVWATKYRYKIIKGDIAIRLRELLRQGCEAEKIVIIKGNISPDYVHMLISFPTNMSLAKIVQYLK